MVAVTAGGVTFEVDAIAYDKDGTLVDLDAAWGPAARAWVETAAQGDAALKTHPWRGRPKTDGGAHECPPAAHCLPSGL